MDLTAGQASDHPAMITYVALLRGINVGGQRQIKMAALQQCVEAMGCSQVKTYIQSGNVVFQAAEEAAPLRQRMEREIAAAFGFPVTLVLRSARELGQAIAQCPFVADALAPGESLYVALLADAPTPAGIDRLLACRSETDEYHLAGREVYLLCRQSYHQTLFSNAFLERKLGVPATSRNWRTITTLAGMAGVREP